jgi:hypothetical protein
MCDLPIGRKYVIYALFKFEFICFIKEHFLCLSSVNRGVFTLNKN